MLKDLITTASIYVDANQRNITDLKGRPGFEVRKLEWPGSDGRKTSCDYAWRHNDMLVGIEEKRPADLGGSMGGRRLQRQLRQLLDACDIAVLALRCHEEYSGDRYDFIGGALTPDYQMLRLAEWANRGHLVFMPSTDLHSYLPKLRSCIGKREHLAILAGTDRQRAAGRTPFQTAMRRLFNGMGPVIAAKLEAAYGGDFMKAITSSPADWRAAGIHKGLCKQLEALQTPC